MVTIKFEELGIPYDCKSMSEKCQAFRDFCSSNYPEGFEHVYETMEDQAEKGPCLLHPTGECKVESVDLACFGTPCDPYSRQRPKRWVDGSVKAHEDYGTTFQASVNLLKAYEPKVAIMEQVDGFDMKYGGDDDATPLSRPVASCSLRRSVQASLFLVCVFLYTVCFRVICHMSYVISCHIICHMSYVICHIVICHMSYVVYGYGIIVRH